MSFSKSRPRESLVRERWCKLVVWRLLEGREMSLTDFSVMMLGVEEFAFWAVLMVSGVGGRISGPTKMGFVSAGRVEIPSIALGCGLSSTSPMEEYLSGKAGLGDDRLALGDR